MPTRNPIIFTPLFFERIWGGRQLEKLYKKPLPVGALIGESWELVDRPDAQSVVEGEEFYGATLGALWETHRKEIFGKKHLERTGRFPLLFKWLDAHEKLSVQVHPPLPVAQALKGEPKTEMWVVTHTEPDAAIFVGLKDGTTKEMFERALADGNVEAFLHRIPTQEGTAMFLPSGRVHAIGAGNVIFEVQQNSDTTYRVFDWNRTDRNGIARELHVEASLRAIDFKDYEPELCPTNTELLVDDPLFRVERWELTESRTARAKDDFAVITVIHGKVACGEKIFSEGSFFLIPASMNYAIVAPIGEKAEILRTTLPVKV